MAARKFIDLASEIRKNVLSGRYGIEGGLPEIRELALRYGVAKNTVTAALSNLEGQGLIEKRGHSYYVNQISIIMTEYVPPVPLRLPSGSGYYKNIGLVERIYPPEYLVEKLKAPPKTAVYRAQVGGEIVNGNEKPLQISYRYHFIDLSDEQVQRMQDDPTYEPLLGDSKYETKLFSLDEVVPRLATEDEKILLGLSEDTPVTHIFEAVSLGDDILMVQEQVVSPRYTLIFAFPFENKPKQ